MRRTRIADIAIIHSQTSLLIISGRGVPRPLQSLAEARLCKEVCFLFFGCFAEEAQGVGGAVVFGEGVEVSPHYIP